MAYNKVYNRTYWNNDKAPAINETNLNNIESGIDTIDSRVVEIGNDVIDVKSGLTDLAYGENSGSKNLFDEVYNFDGDNIVYRHINVGNGTYTVSSDIPLDSSSADIFAIANKVTSGASTGSNGVYSGKTRTITSTDGYVTIAYRRIGTINPSDYHTMVNVGTTALPYEQYVMSNKQLGALNNSLKDLAFGDVSGSSNLFNEKLTILGSGASDNGSEYLFHDFWNANNSITISVPKLKQFVLAFNGKTSTADASFYILTYEDGTNSDIKNGVNLTTSYDSKTMEFNESKNVTKIRMGLNHSEYTGYILKNTIQINSGLVKLPYEPYVMSNKQLSSLNDSLNAQGLLNKFDGVLENKVYSSSGVVQTDNRALSNVNRISCVGGDLINIEIPTTANYITICYFNASGGFISRVLSSQTIKSFENTAPSNATSFVFTLQMVNDTPTTYSGVIAYVNNDIKSLKADLQNASGGSSNYSTTEKVVGKWIDGRNIYEQTFDIDVTSASGNVRRVLVSGIDFCVDSKGYISGDCGSTSFGIVKFPIPYYGGGTYGNGTVSANVTVLQNGDMELLYRWNVTGKDLKIQVVAQYVKK